MRREELNLAFNLNWAVKEPKVIEQVVAENRARTKVREDLGTQYERLCILIWSDRVPT
jgi:hypothetical protein